MKTGHIATLGILTALFTASAYADDKMPTPNTAYVKIEVGEFFGLVKRNTAEVKITMPSENFYGFTGIAQTTADREKATEMNKYAAENITKIINVEDALCIYSLDKLKTRNIDDSDKKEERKSNTLYVKVSYDVQCDKPLKNHKMNLDLSKFYNIAQMTVKLEQPIKDEKMTISGKIAKIDLK